MRAQGTTKQLLQRAIEELPDEVTVEEAVERLYLALKVQRGLDQVRDGEEIPHEEIEQSVKNWLE